MAEEVVSIGQRLREVRGGMSQSEFAEVLGVHQNTIANYETGKRLPDAAVISTLFNKMQVDPTWLITGSRELMAGLSDEESSLLENYRSSGEQKSLIHTVAVAIASLEKGKNNPSL